jgi:phage shock protein C
MTPQKKLTLSETDKKIGGVCGGLAEYLGVDSNLIRILWVLFALFVGSGVLVYIVAWILLPSKAGS